MLILVKKNQNFAWVCIAILMIVICLLKEKVYKFKVNNKNVCNWTRTHKHLGHKRTLNHWDKLAKWLSCVLSTSLYGAFDCMFLSCHVRVSDFAYASRKDFVDIQAAMECGFTPKCILDMIRTYSQMHRTDKSSLHSPNIWPVWLNGWVLLYELSACGFESSSSHLDFRFRSIF